jgi:hypothetical protein
LSGAGVLRVAQDDSKSTIKSKCKRDTAADEGGIASPTFASKSATQMWATRFVNIKSKNESTGNCTFKSKCSAVAG